MSEKKILVPNIGDFKEVEVIEVGTPRSKPLYSYVRHLDALFEVEAVEVGATRNKLLNPNVRHLVAPT